MTSAKRRHDELTIDRPERFLQRERAAQKAGVGLLTLFVVAGAVGMFGSGPLADATVISGRATVHFERFTRQTIRTHLDVSVSGANGPSVTIQMPRAFLDRVDLIDVRPPDTLMHFSRDAATFEVPVVDGSASLVLNYEPKNHGVLDADVVAANGPPARVRQIVFF